MAPEEKPRVSNPNETPQPTEEEMDESNAPEEEVDGAVPDDPEDE